jgi:hypothetical protein
LNFATNFGSFILHERFSYQMPSTQTMVSFYKDSSNCVSHSQVTVRRQL